MNCDIADAIVTDIQSCLIETYQHRIRLNKLDYKYNLNTIVSYDYSWYYYHPTDAQVKATTGMLLGYLDFLLEGVCITPPLTRGGETLPDGLMPQIGHGRVKQILPVTYIYNDPDFVDHIVSHITRICEYRCITDLNEY